MPRVCPVFNSGRSIGTFSPRPEGRDALVEAARLRARPHTLGAGVGLTPTLDHAGGGVVADEVTQRREHENAAAEIARLVEAGAARVAILIDLAIAPFLAAVLEHAARAVAVARR